MQKLDLILFYTFGKEMRTLTRSGEKPYQMIGRIGNKMVWLLKFFNETNDVPIPKTREAGHALFDYLSELHGRVLGSLTEDGLAASDVPDDADSRLKTLLERFEREFDHESRELAVFAVTPKGDRSTRVLIEEAEKKFPPNLLAVMPQKTIEDIQEAGRCLAFERATACAFHICRATEALMLEYYEALTGQPWPGRPMRKEWAVYNDQLRVNGAPPAITNRLGELRDDRNSYAHPDNTVPLDEAPIVYDLCTGVMFYMAKEIEKLQAAKVAASSPSSPLSPP